jgi:hypothetical protein
VSWRLISAVAIGVAATLSLVSCGSSTQSTETSSTTGQTQPAEAASGESGSKSEASSDDAKALAGMRASILRFGQAGTKAETRTASAHLAAYFFDREGEDWGPACSYLSAEMQARLKQIGGRGSAGCGKGIEAMTARASMDEGEAAIVKVKGLRKEGRQGFLIYRTDAGKTNAMLMVLEGGEWRLGGVNPTPLFP